MGSTYFLILSVLTNRLLYPFPLAGLFLRKLIRRLFKLMCISLNETYGFGKRRLECVLGQISDLVEEHDRDEVYWAHVDRVVIDGLGVKFKREAEE